MARLFLATVLVALTIGTTGPRAADEPKVDLNMVCLEVEALRTLSELQLTRQQLEELNKLTKGAAAKTPPRKEAKASAKFAAALHDLQKALTKGDEDRIGEAEARVTSLRNEERPQLDDRIVITEAARKQTPAASKLFTARQVANHIAHYGEELPEPLAEVRETLRASLRDKENRWEHRRDETAATVAWLVAGLDAEKTVRVRERMAAFLDTAHRWKADELEKRSGELAKSVQEITGDADPLEMLRHLVERDMATLLSNPQLSAAIEARLTLVR
jgi:hypothetical protein